MAARACGRNKTRTDGAHHNLIALIADLSSGVLLHRRNCYFAVGKDKHKGRNPVYVVFIGT